MPIDALNIEHVSELDIIRLESVLSVDLLAALRATVKRLCFLFAPDLKPFSELLADGCESSLSPEVAIQHLDSLLEFEAPLPGTAGSIRPSKPPPAKHFRRHRG